MFCLIIYFKTLANKISCLNKIEEDILDYRGIIIDDNKHQTHIKNKTNALAQTLKQTSRIEILEFIIYLNYI